jgi:hypothetical protein
MVDGHLAVGCVGGIDADEGSGVLAGSGAAQQSPSRCGDDARIRATGKRTASDEESR